MAGLMSSIENSLEVNTSDIFNHSNSTICGDVYYENRDFYSKYQWVAALDSYTCLICANLDNQLFDLLPNMEGALNQGEARAPEQPIHHNCRCFMVPVLIGDEEATTSQPNYKEWFERQSNETKLDILGPSRFAEYKKGMEISGFVKDDKIATLDDLGIERKYRIELLQESYDESNAGTWKAEDLPEYKNIYTDKMSNEELVNKFYERNGRKIEIDLPLKSNITNKGLRMVLMETDKLLTQYPINTISKIRLGSDMELASYLISPKPGQIIKGAYNSKTKEMILNELVVLNPASGQRTVVHEFGHAFRQYMLKEGQISENTFINMVKKECKVKNWEDIAKIFSKHAAKDESEFMATSFEAFYNNHKYYNNKYKNDVRLAPIWDWYIKKGFI